VQRGVDLYKVKELRGHEDIKMTMRYAHLAPEGLPLVPYMASANVRA